MRFGAGDYDLLCKMEVCDSRILFYISLSIPEFFVRKILDTVVKSI